MTKKILLLLSLCLFGVSSAWASSPPDPKSNEVLANIINNGAKIYYMGTRGGLDGWFVIKDGKVQIAYSGNDKKTAIVGVMFGPNGENVGGEQVRDLLANNKEIADMLSNELKVMQGPTAAPVAQAQAQIAAAANAAASPGEKLMADLGNAFGVTVGTGGPQIYMVMDPNCPHCRKTWTALRDTVLQGGLRIRMIPIAQPGSDDERAAGIFLKATDPTGAWDKYVAGDKTQLSGTPDATQTAALLANHKLVDAWNIHATPTLVYRGKDGQVKIVQGEPDKPAALLADVAP